MISKCDSLLCTTAAIFYWLNPCDWIVACALMSYCCELNSLNRNANARMGEKCQNDMTWWRDAVTHSNSKLFAVLYVSCTMLRRQTKSSACVRACVHVIGMESNANANGELHVRSTRASNNSFHLNYRSNCSRCPTATLFLFHSVRLTNRKFIQVFTHLNNFDGTHICVKQQVRKKQIIESSIHMNCVNVGSKIIQIKFIMRFVLWTMLNTIYVWDSI